MSDTNKTAEKTTEQYLEDIIASKDKKIEALKKEIESWKKKHFDMVELASDTIQKKNNEIQALKWSIQNFED